jgi:hypothetical protein
MNLTNVFHGAFFQRCSRSPLIAVHYSRLPPTFSNPVTLSHKSNQMEGVFCTKFNIRPSLAVSLTLCLVSLGSNLATYLHTTRP